MDTKIAVPFAMNAVLLPLVSSQAHGRALTQEQGHGRVITSLLWSNSDKAFDDDGEAFGIADYKKTEIYFAAEYGFTDNLTLLLTPSLRRIAVQGGRYSRGFGYTDIGARYRLVNSGHVVLSTQGLARKSGRQASRHFGAGRQY